LNFFGLVESLYLFVVLFFGLWIIYVDPIFIHSCEKII
jgi:hypothetical protein